MRQGGDFAENRMVAIEALPRIAPLALRQHRAGEAISERRFADTLGPDDEPGMVHASALERVMELAERRLMAEQTIDLPRQ